MVCGSTLVSKLLLSKNFRRIVGDCQKPRYARIEFAAAVMAAMVSFASYFSVTSASLFASI
jgi:hypothetical protein